MRRKTWFLVLLLSSLWLALGAQVVFADDPTSPSPMEEPSPLVLRPTPAGLIRFTGVVNSRPEETTVGIWVIGGRSVSVVETTQFDESEGPAEVGAEVLVIARPLPTTTAAAVHLEAILIRVVTAADRTRPATIRGIVAELEPTYLVVNGLRILYDRSTHITGRLAVGALVKVVVVRTAAGLKALSIEVLPQSNRIIEFEGTIQYISAQAWVVAGRRVKINAHTVILGTPEIGLRAKVWALVLPSRELLALLIEVQDEPQIVEWTGPIEHLPPNITIYPPTYIGRWVVGGRSVWVTRETEIVGTPRIGLPAHVLAYRHANRPLVAKRIAVLRGVTEQE